MLPLVSVKGICSMFSALRARFASHSDNVGGMKSSPSVWLTTNHFGLYTKLVYVCSSFVLLSSVVSSLRLRVIGMHRISARSPRLTFLPSACQPGNVLIGPGCILRNWHWVIARI